MSYVQQQKQNVEGFFTTGLFYNCQKALEIQKTLNALGHPQEKTEVKIDNSTAKSFIQDTLRLKRSKTWDMR